MIGSHPNPTAFHAFHPPLPQMLLSHSSFSQTRSIPSLPPSIAPIESAGTIAPDGVPLRAPPTSINASTPTESSQSTTISTNNFKRPRASSSAHISNFPLTVATKPKRAVSNEIQTSVQPTVARTEDLSEDDEDHDETSHQDIDILSEFDGESEDNDGGSYTSDDTPKPKRTMSNSTRPRSGENRSKHVPSSYQSQTVPAPADQQSVIVCGILDPNRESDEDDRIFMEDSPYFNQLVDVYTALDDPRQRTLYRASALAHKFHVATNQVGMYLVRRRHQQYVDGLYQALSFQSKPIGRTGLKSGGYFVSIEVCREFEEYMKQHNKHNRHKGKASSRRLKEAAAAYNKAEKLRLEENQRAILTKPSPILLSPSSSSSLSSTTSSSNSTFSSNSVRAEQSAVEVLLRVSSPSGTPTSSLVAPSPADVGQIAPILSTTLTSATLLHQFASANMKTPPAVTSTQAELSDSKNFDTNTKRQQEKLKEVSH